MQPPPSQSLADSLAGACLRAVLCSDSLGRPLSTVSVLAHSGTLFCIIFCLLAKAFMSMP